MNPSDMDEAEKHRLLCDWLAGQLAPEDASRLMRAAQADGALRRELAALQTIERLLRHHGVAAGGDELFVGEVIVRLREQPVSQGGFASAVIDRLQFPQPDSVVQPGEAGQTSDDPQTAGGSPGGLRLIPHPPRYSQAGDSQAGDSQAENDNVAATIYCAASPPSRSSWRKWGALAAALAVLTGGWLWWPKAHVGVSARLESSGEGMTHVRGGQAVSALERGLARPGDLIRTARDSQATLRFDGEATAITLTGEAELAMAAAQPGKRLELNYGQMEAVVDKQPADAPLVCVTPEVEITVLGTRFFVSAAEGTTRAVVKEGKVRVKDRATGATVELSAGQLAVAARQSPPKVESFETAPKSVLPQGWMAQDVGGVALPGSAVFDSAGGTFTVKGSGTDIWHMADGFHFVQQAVAGDCEITARVAGLENTDEWAKAGLMIRETLAADSKRAIAFVSSENGAKLQWRSETGATTDAAGTTLASAPYWLRLARSGNTFTGYESSNGTTWTEIGSVTISMAPRVYIGLAVTSRDGTTLCTATFDNVTVTPKARESASLRIGNRTADRIRSL